MFIDNNITNNIDDRVMAGAKYWDGELIQDLSQRPASIAALKIDDIRMIKPLYFLVYEDLIGYLIVTQLSDLNCGRIELITDDGVKTISSNLENQRVVTDNNSPDTDIEKMSTYELRKELLKIRGEIRYHRDQKGDDRCWLDDVKLYKILPEGHLTYANFSLPCREGFLKSCSKFWETRQPEGDKLHEW